MAQAERSAERDTPAVLSSGARGLVVREVGDRVRFGRDGLAQVEEDYFCPCLGRADRPALLGECLEDLDLHGCEQKLTLYSSACQGYQAW